MWRKLFTGRGPWGFADQVLISGTNFVTMVYAARGLGKTGFGEFSNVYNALLFVNIIQVSMVSQPHNVLGTGHGRGQKYKDYTASTAAEQVAILIVQTVIVLGFVLLAQARGWNCQGLLLALAAAMPAWAIQEFFRRILYTEGRRAAAFANDIISYGGQAVWIVALYWLDLHKAPGAPARLTGASALYVLAITSGVAAIIGFLQVRPSMMGRISLKTWVENWHFGKWLLGSEVLVYCSSLPMYMYLVTWFVDAGASGQLSAAQKLFGPTRIISYYLATVLPIQFAHQLAEGGNEALRRGMRQCSMRVLPIVGGFCLLIALFARPLLSIFGRDFAAEPGVLAMYAMVAFAAYIQMVLSAALTAKRVTRVIFIGTLGGALVTAVLSCVLIKWMGIYGALIGMLLTALVIAALLWRGYHKSLQVESTQRVIPPRDIASEEVTGGFPVIVTSANEPPPELQDAATRSALNPVVCED